MIDEILNNLRKEVPDLEVIEEKRGLRSDFYIVQSHTMTPAQAKNIIQNIDFFCGKGVKAESSEKAKCIVIELERQDKTLVLWKDYYDKAENAPLSVCFGANPFGEPVVADIAKMPHLLVAGATGQGKSVAIHNILATVIKKNTPNDVRLVLIDPKKVEFTIYQNAKNLFFPVLTETEHISDGLKFLVEEMEFRYTIFSKKKYKDIGEYNDNEATKIPLILVVIDELADIVLEKDKEFRIDKLLIKLAQKARAAGIHLVVSTQRPSTDIISGLIKANFPSRLALKTSNIHDSRTILGEGGAEFLLGAGDSYLLNKSKMSRCLGSYITTEEIEEVL